MISSSSGFRIKERQRGAFTKVLSKSTSVDRDEQEWKVLVCDSQAYDIITSLFRLAILRQYGVTMHCRINNPRSFIPDVPAMYFIEPSPENVAWIARDFSSKPPLYDSAAIYFSSTTHRSLLTALATQLPVPSPIQSVYDMHANFISLEEDLFSLNIANSYYKMKSVNDEKTTKEYVDSIVSGLFSVLVTLGTLPIIRAQKGGAAEAISAALDAKLRENLSLFQNASLSSRAFSFRRPLLLMLDRDFDFNTMFHHTWTYQALIHDCMQLKLNQLTLDNETEEVGKQPKKRKVLPLNKESDFFWEDNAGHPFPTVADAIQTALTKYREDVEQINRKASAESSNGIGGEIQSMGTSQLAASIMSLPELSKRKEMIDVHTNIATELLNNINKRCLDAFFELESEIINESFRSSSSTTPETYKVIMMELLKGVRELPNGEKRGEGTAMDRLRLFLIYYSVFGYTLAEKEVAEVRGILHGVGADTAAIAYIGKLRGYRHELVQEPTLSVSGSLNTAKLKGLMTNVMNRGYRSIANAAQNASKLVVEEKRRHPVARTLEIFMNEKARGGADGSARLILDSYLLFDPKTAPMSTTSLTDVNEKHSTYKRMKDTVFSDAIVFTVGGGNYVEYENCKQINSSSRSLKNILYGTTEMVTPDSFLTQLTEVAKNYE